MLEADLLPLDFLPGGLTGIFFVVIVVEEEPVCLMDFREAVQVKNVSMESQTGLRLTTLPTAGIHSGQPERTRLPMAHTTFTQDIFIAAPYAVVRERLARLMTDVTEVHPFVMWTRHVKSEHAADGAQTDYYLVHDRMKLGPFPIQFTYKVDMTVTATGQLVSNAYQSPGIHLHNTTWCEPEDNGTRVREHIEITAPALLMKTTYKGAADSHIEMFEKLRTSIEKEQTPA